MSIFAGVTTPNTASIPIARNTSGDNCKFPRPNRNPCPPIGETSNVQSPSCSLINSSNDSSFRSVPTCSLPKVASIPRRVGAKPIPSAMVRRVPPEPQMIRRLESATNTSAMCSPRASSTSSSSVAWTRIFAPCIHRGLAGIIASPYIRTDQLP